MTQQQYDLFNIQDLFLQKLAAVLGTHTVALASGQISVITVQPANEVVVYIEIGSVGLVPATSALGRLNMHSSSQLTNQMQLPIISYVVDTHVGNVWHCDNHTAGLCFNHGVCNTSVGVCICEIGWVGTNCETTISQGIPARLMAYQEEESVSLAGIIITAILLLALAIGLWLIYQKRKLLRALFVTDKTDDVAQQVRHMMALRRMAAGKTAADAFSKTHAVDAAGRAHLTTGAAATDVWHITASRNADPDTSDEDAASQATGEGLASGWLRVAPTL